MEDYTEYEYGIFNNVDSDTCYKNIRDSILNVLRERKKDESIQYSDVEDDFLNIKFHIECIQIIMKSNGLDSNNVELINLYDILDRELYSSKGAIDCVSIELENIYMHIQKCISQSQVS